MDYFGVALAHVLTYEGGFSDHPSDPGGATMQGVTQATYDSYRRDNGWPTQPVQQITRDEVEEIYRTRYWDAIGGDELEPALAFVLFDSAVNSGVSRALGWLDQTRDWRELILIRLSFYVSLSTFDTFGKGWTRRLAAVREQAEQLDTTPHGARLLRVFNTNNTEVHHLRIPEGCDVITRATAHHYFVRLEERK